VSTGSDSSASAKAAGSMGSASADIVVGVLWNNPDLSLRCCMDLLSPLERKHLCKVETMQHGIMVEALQIDVGVGKVARALPRRVECNDGTSDTMSRTTCIIC